MPDWDKEPDRKLAAIMVADVVGFSRLMAADEEGTLARWAELRQEAGRLIAEYGGRIFKSVGDGFLAEFSSVVRALSCAMRCQSGAAAWNAQRPPAQRMLLRVGLHQGDVVVQNGDLLGDSVNVAARLEAMAEPGGICISERVRQDAAGKLALDVVDLGLCHLKNLDPMRCYGLRPPPESPPPSASGEHYLHPIGNADTALVPLTAKPLTLGRQAPSQIILSGGDVSRVHCRIELAGHVAVVTDLNSTNGTFVNGRRIDGPTLLPAGALLSVGTHTWRHENHDFADSTCILPVRNPAPACPDAAAEDSPHLLR